MTKNVQMPGGDESSENDKIGLDRQLRVDTSSYELRVHDGVTPGGHRLPNAEGVSQLITKVVAAQTGAQIFTVADLGALANLVPSPNKLAVVTGVDVEDVFVWRAGAGDSGTVTSNLTGHWRRLDAQAGIAIRLWRAGLLELQIGGSAPASGAWLDSGVLKLYDGSAYVAATPALYKALMHDGMAPTGYLLAVNDLSDVDDAATALGNLGGLAASAYTATDVIAKLLTVDGIGSGLDAALVNGFGSSANATPDTVVIRNGSGDVKGRLFRSEYDTLNSSVNYITTQAAIGGGTADNPLRPSTPAQVATALAPHLPPVAVGLTDIGSFIFAYPASASTFIEGATISGSSLRYASLSSTLLITGGVVGAGTWRNHGASSTNARASVWQRIA